MEVGKSQTLDEFLYFLNYTEGKAAALERRLVLKTRFRSQSGWGSGPLLSAKRKDAMHCVSKRKILEKSSIKNKWQ